MWGLLINVNNIIIILTLILYRAASHVLSISVNL